MAAEGAVAADTELHSDPEDGDPNYKIPDKVTAKDMLSKDQDDPALQKYKEELLGKNASHITGDPTKVTLKKMTLISLTDDVKKEVDLTNILTQKLPTITIKEGVQYKIEFQFVVENDIVTGLKYHHVVKRKGLNVDKDTQMLGSFKPDPENVVTITISENDMPSGMLARGHYSVKSQFLDDDKNVYLKWEWSFDLGKDWS